MCVCKREKTGYMWSFHLKLSQMVFVNWPWNIIQLGLIKTLYGEEREKLGEERKKERDEEKKEPERVPTCAVLSYMSHGEGVYWIIMFIFTKATESKNISLWNIIENMFRVTFKPQIKPVFRTLSIFCIVTLFSWKFPLNSHFKFLDVLLFSLCHFSYFH